MNTDRRRFLKNTGAMTAAGLMGNLGTWGVRSAQAAGSDFKALVGVFLFGGNDSNNMVIPTDATRWGQYAAVRTAASGIGLDQATLQPITDASTGNPYGLHPNLPDLKSIYDNGKMAVIANAGTLLAPIPDITTCGRAAIRPLPGWQHG
jgi:uncharacterized protein (DUF1501 family)